MEYNVIDYLVRSAEKFPAKVALVDRETSMTFGEVLSESHIISQMIIRDCGDIINRPIVVYMEKKVECLCCFFGISLSGNFYSPLDVKMPEERLAKIIEVLKPAAVITDMDIVPEVFLRERIIHLSERDNMPSGRAVQGRTGRVLDVDPCYVLFTSGSTGIPKGVVISHRSVIDYTEWLEKAFDFDENTVFGNQAPFYFDNSILDIYSTLKNGSTLVIIPEKDFILPGRVLQFLNEYHVNTIFWVPSALIGVANSNAIEEIKLQYIEKILFCGEVMPNKQLNRWRSLYPSVLYANLYGPTEITDVCSYYIVDRNFSDDEPLPIGKACENTEILILKEDGTPAGKGETGELCVRGIGLSLGYYDNEKKTKDVFIQNPGNHLYRDLIYKTGDLVKLNGRDEIIYLGRKDFQIKHQGHRIELGEIEAAAGGIDALVQSCAVYDDAHKRIVLVCIKEKEITEKEIYKFLQSKLPRYMLPAKIQFKDHFQTNLNGKIDRRILTEEVKLDE